MSYVIGSKIAWFPSCTGPSIRPGFRSPYLASVSMKFGRGSQKRLIWRSFPAYGAFRYESRSGRGRTRPRSCWTKHRLFWTRLWRPTALGWRRATWSRPWRRSWRASRTLWRWPRAVPGGSCRRGSQISPGSSTYFRGGVIAYADRVKLELLGVEEAVLVENGAVSEAVAAGMACGVADLLNADIGVGITGIAGPGGGTSEKPVGTVWCAVAAQGGVRTSHRVFGGDREAVRERASQMALLLLYQMLADRP